MRPLTLEQVLLTEQPAVVVEDLYGSGFGHRFGRLAHFFDKGAEGGRAVQYDAVDGYQIHNRVVLKVNLALRMRSFVGEANKEEDCEEMDVCFHG